MRITKIGVIIIQINSPFSDNRLDYERRGLQIRRSNLRLAHSSIFVSLLGFDSHLPDTMSKGRVLSIQSHVAFGYAGGKAAVFPLQCLGYDVDVSLDLARKLGQSFSCTRA